MFDAQAIIAEAAAEQNKPVNATEQNTQATSKEAQDDSQNGSNETQESSQETDDIAKKPDSELTPEQLAKREANRQSHLNRKLAKQRLRNENAELKAKIAELEQSVQRKPVKSGEIPADYPKEEEHETLLDYLKAVAKYEAKQELKTTAQKQPESQLDPVKVQNIQNVSQQADRLAKDVPEYKVLYAQHQEILAMMPESVMDAFLEAENAPLALYALMKEGRLEDLEDLPASRVAMEIGRAEERGKSYLGTVKKATSAPPPIESLKGTGRASKSLDELSVEELMKKFNR